MKLFSALRSKKNKYLILKAVKDAAKILSFKMLGKHPSKKEMISFVKKYSNVISYKIYREHNKNDVPDEFYPASYYQYLVLSINSYPFSKSSINISTLPYKEISKLLNISPREFEEEWNWEEDEDETEDEDEAEEDDWEEE